MEHNGGIVGGRGAGGQGGGREVKRLGKIHCPLHLPLESLRYCSFLCTGEETNWYFLTGYFFFLH